MTTPGYDQLVSALVATGTERPNAERLVRRKLGIAQPSETPSTNTPTSQRVVTLANAQQERRVERPVFPEDHGTVTDDYARIMQVLEVLCPNADELRCIKVDGEPCSKARPRFSHSGKAYNSKKQREATRALSWRLRAAFNEPARGNVAVSCIFYRSKGQRIDVDNLLKQVLDAANGIVWVDDYQVTAIVGVVERDAGAPRTVIGIAEHQSSMSRDLDRSRSCERCGKPFKPPFADSAQRFCSRRCASQKSGVDLSIPIECPHCHKPFRRRIALQKFCGIECRQGALKGRLFPWLPHHKAAIERAKND